VNTPVVDLSIIIPTYNEAMPVAGVPRLERSLEQLSVYLARHASQLAVDIVVVDARSPDGTAQVVLAHPGVQLIDAGPRPAGQFTKGRQVALGMLGARGQYRLFMDADLATPLHHLQQVFALMARNEPLGIGVRPLGVTHRGVRQHISRSGNYLAQWLLVPGIEDTQCGFKVFRADVAQALFSRQRIGGFGFDLEVLALARQLGYPCTVLPIDDWRDVKQGSKLGGVAIAKVAVGVLADIARIRWALHSGLYDEPASACP